MRLRIGALMKIQARVDTSNRIKIFGEMGEVLENGIHERSQNARITH
jgi:hypothetical protein